MKKRKLMPSQLVFCFNFLLVGMMPIFTTATADQMFHDVCVSPITIYDTCNMFQKIKTITHLIRNDVENNTPTPFPSSKYYREDGIIFTGRSYKPGQAVISLRFDDGRIEDYVYVFPQLASRDLVGGFAIVRKLILNYPTSTRMSLPQMLTMQAAGNEMMDHSYNHDVDPLDYDAFYFETVTAADEMRSLGLNIVSFVAPGTWTISYPDGYKIDSSLFFNSPEDLLLRANFLAYEAYGAFPFDGQSWGYWQLPIASPYGGSKVAADTYNFAIMKTRIDNAIKAGEAVEFQWHSVNLDKDGYMSKSDFEAVLDYLEEKIAEGALLVMTPTQQALAKPLYESFFPLMHR